MTQTEASDREKNTERDRDTASQGPRPRAITRQTGGRTSTPSNTERRTRRQHARKRKPSSGFREAGVSANRELLQSVLCGGLAQDEGTGDEFQGLDSLSPPWKMD